MEAQSIVKIIVDNFLFIVILASLIVSAGLSLWKLFKDRENEVKCPGCGRLWAAERVGEELMGIFRKHQPRLLASQGRSIASDYKMVEYEKYKIHYKCKYCSHEWEFFKSRKL